MSWLGNIVRFFAKLFSPEIAKKVTEGVKKAAPYVNHAFELVALAAEFTEIARTPATVLRVANVLGVKALFKPDATYEELGTALRDIVVNALKLRFPNVDRSILNLAVEMAYSAFRGR